MGKKNKKQPQETNDVNNQQPSTWSTIKQVYKIRKAHSQQLHEEREQIRLEKKQRKKQQKLENKQEIKRLKADLKALKKQHKSDLKTLKAQKLNKQELQANISEINREYNNNRVSIYDKIKTIRFNYGKEFNTIPWKLTKWAHGIKKEFFRIIWSSPKNTFKYLGIIVIIVAFLSLIFLFISWVVTKM